MVFLTCAGSALADETYENPVYVGAEKCAKCHQGADMGYQHCRWLVSEHSKAYASLAKPESAAGSDLVSMP